MKTKLIFSYFLSFLSLVGCSKPDRANSTNEQKDESNLIENSSNVLISYFSCSSNTKKVSTYINESIDSTLYEIIPKEKYTSDDLNYSDINSRAYKEQNSSSSRPEIGSEKISNFNNYDVIFLGYPLWFSQAPKIIYTFIESYDFSNKTVIPFCTSSSSPIGSSATNLYKDINSGKWLEGKRFSSNAIKEDVYSWAKSFFNKKEDNMNLKNITFYVDSTKLETSIEDNSSTNDLFNKLKDKEVNITLSRYGGFEQVGSLPFSLNSNHTTLTSSPGDIFLYQSNQIVLFYGNNTYSYTKLAHINLEETKIKSLLDKKSVNLIIKLEQN